jgi:transcription initiation factor TFIIB
MNPKCGLLYKSLDYTAEWSYYGAEEAGGVDPTRCGMPINPFLSESSFACKVFYTRNMTYEMRKIRRFTEWQAMSYKEKTQYNEFQTIATMSNHSNIPKMIIDEAIRMHKKISEKDFHYRGANREGIVAASIYIACRAHNFPRTAKEIAAIFHLNVAAATKGCKNAMGLLKSIEADESLEDKTNYGCTSADSFIARYCSFLEVSERLSLLCKFLVAKIEREGWMLENAPQSIAVGVIYFVVRQCGPPNSLTKNKIFHVSKISEVTITKCYNKLLHISKTYPLIPSEFM